jgi:hypothetical protein
MPRQNTLDSPLTGIPEAMRPVLSPTVAIRTQSPGYGVAIFSVRH